MLRSYRKGAAPIQKIQIFGERCSGTNYLEALLKENIHPDILTWEFGWKHWFSTDPRKGVPDHLFLIIYRHPVTWLQSFQRRPWHAGPALKKIDFQSFIRHEWYSVFDEDSELSPTDTLWGKDIEGDLNPRTGKRFRNVIAMRNAKNRHFERMKKRFANVCYLRYEDLQSSPEALLRELAAEYSLPLKDIFQPVPAYKGVGDTYIPKEYETIALEDYAFLRRQLKLRQEKTLGYTLPPLRKP